MKWWVWVAALLVVPAAIAAQRIPDAVRSAEPVRLWVGPRVATGRVVMIDADRLNFEVDTCPLRVGRRCVESFRLEMVERLDVASGTYALEGAGIGLLLGLGVGLAVASSWGGGGEHGGVIVLAPAIVTTPLGLIFGAGTRRWKEVYRSGGRASSPVK